MLCTGVTGCGRVLAAGGSFVNGLKAVEEEVLRGGGDGCIGSLG